MTRAKVFVGLAVLIGAFTAFVAPGFAEFESKNSEPKGKGEIAEATFDDGGTVIACQTPEEGISKVGWTVENEESKEQKKGVDLRMDIEKWGNCKYVAASSASGEAKLSGCEMELKQTATESKIPVRITSTCTITVGTCEIKIAPGSNKELKTMQIGETGESSENTAIFPVLANIVTEVNKECAPYGIQASKTVALDGDGELDDVHSAAPLISFKRVNDGKFNTEPPGVNGDETEEFLFPTGEEGETPGFRCEEAKYTGKIPMATDLLIEVLLPASYEKCTANGRKAEVTTNNHCVFIYLIAKEEDSTEFRGQMRIGSTGSPACEIKLTSLECKVVINAQLKPHYSIRYWVLAESLQVRNSLEDLKYTVKEAKGCAGNFVDNEEANNGLFLANFTLSNVVI
jgi:hypothetical protein